MYVHTRNEIEYTFENINIDTIHKYEIYIDGGLDILLNTLEH